MQKNEYQIVTLIVVVIIVLIIACFFIFILVAYSNNRKRKYIEEKIARENEFQQEILKTQLEIQEQTLKNISQEIHDNIGQVLSLAKINLAIIPGISDEKAANKITEARTLIGKAIQDLRDLSRGINTDLINELGLIRSIEGELETIRRTGLFEASLIIKGSSLSLGQQTELVLFRIFQELLNNVIKHSGASAVNIVMDYSADHFIFDFSDNGNGFLRDGAGGSSKPGIGLRNIENRTKMIGASFDLISTPGSGTRVRIMK